MKGDAGGNDDTDRNSYDGNVMPVMKVVAYLSAIANNNNKSCVL
jgi:hypothetical protein